MEEEAGGKGPGAGEERQCCAVVRLGVLCELLVEKRYINTVDDDGGKIQV